MRPQKWGPFFESRISHPRIWLTSSIVNAVAAEEMGLKIVIVLALCSVAFSQTKKTTFASVPQEDASAVRAFSPQLRSELGKVRDAAMQDNYAYSELEFLTDSIGPRPAGSPQADAAVHYVADEMRKLGLEVRLEPVTVQQFIRGSDAAELVQYPGQVPQTVQKIYVTALLGNKPTPPGGLTADVVVVHNFDELKALPRQRVAGRIVLFNYRFDSQKASAGRSGAAYRDAVQYRGSGAVAAAEAGAVGCLVRSAGDGEVRLTHTGWSNDTTLPAGAVSAEDADLIDRLALRGNVRIRLTLPTHHGPDVTGYNVIADLKGTEHPEQVIIVSGHLDSWDLGTGAIDDAAGVAVAMETAELLHRLHLRPKRTIRMIAWMNEEMGANGRDVYAKEFESQLADHIAAIESDLGAEHPLGFHAKISDAAQNQLSPVLQALQPIGADLFDIVATSPETDIEPLADKGVPAFGVWQNGLKYFRYHHTQADTLDKVGPEELRENAACMAVMAYALAQMNAELPR
jgi:carboxypeptidase Q